MLRHTVRQAALGALVLVGASGVGSASARAETIFLTCTRAGDAPLIITIDLTNKTANNLPATISQTAIDWQYQGGSASPDVISSITTHHHIDRTAGTETEYTVFHQTSGGDSQGGSDTLSCTKGVAPATKF